MATRLPRLLFVKSLIVGTRLGDAAGQLRWLLGYGQRRKHPELWELYLEERWLPVILQRLLTRTSCCVDVGSHIGSFLGLLRKFAPGGRHVAFEPSPTKNNWLRRRFRDVEIFPFAVADTAGTAVFEENTARSGYSHLLAPGSGPPKKSDDGSSHYEVQLCRLDDVLLDRGKFDLVKIDVEGGELAALRGAEKLIRKWQPTIIFECGSEYGMVEKARKELYDYVTSGLGYKIFCFADFVFDKGELTFDEFRKCGLYPFRAFNFVAVPHSAPPPAGNGGRHA